MFALLLSLQLSSGETTVDTQEEGVNLLTSETLVLDCALITLGQKPRQRHSEVQIEH